MKTKFILCAAALVFASSFSARSFTIDNHATVAYIAEQHMSLKAVANFRKAFDNHHLVEFASYPDFFRAIYKLNGKEIGHGFTVDENYYPVKAQEGAALKAYDALLHAISQLEDYKTLDDSTKYAAMGLLVHFMGDSHCPSHISYADGRSKKAKYIYYTPYLNKPKGKPAKIKYHAFWDDWCSDQRYDRGYVERSFQFDTATKDEIKKIQQGTLEEMLQASAIACKDCYDVEDGQLVDRVYVIKKASLVATQVRDAGYRLAAIMDKLFK